MRSTEKKLLLCINGEFGSVLEEAFNSGYPDSEVEICTANGELLLSEILSKKPDTVILNDGLDGMSGIDVLARFNETEQDGKTKFIFIFHELDDEAITNAAKLGAVHIFLTPQSAGTIADYAHNRPYEFNNSDLEIFVSTMLYDLFFDPCSKGFRYMRTAILLALTSADQKPEAMHLYYSDIAGMYDTTPKKVGAVLRYSVKAATSRLVDVIAQEYFNGEAPETVGDFFQGLVRYILGQAGYISMAAKQYSGNYAVQKT